MSDDDRSDDWPDRVRTPTTVRYAASPAGLLRWLEQEPGSYRALLDRHGGELAAAAYQLASAKVAVQGRAATATPTERELYAAAREIAARAGIVDFVPPAGVLADTCRREGLQVLPVTGGRRR